MYIDRYYLELKLSKHQGPTKGFLPYVPSLHASGTTAEHREGVQTSHRAVTGSDLTSAPKRLSINDVSSIVTPERNKEPRQQRSCHQSTVEFGHKHFNCLFVLVVPLIIVSVAD